MAEKIFNSRIIHKHATEADWLKATNFYPKQGEIIVYDVDDAHSCERLKVGDGQTLVSNLPFVDDTAKQGISALSTIVGSVNSRVDAVSALVGDVSVSEQITAAISDITAITNEEIDEICTDFAIGNSRAVLNEIDTIIGG